MRIELLDSTTEEKYEDFLLKDSQTLFYASNKFRILLKKFLQAEDNYFLALNNNNDIIGVMPSFLCSNSEHGNILNSLPFFGSNGGIIEYKRDLDVRKSLLKSFIDLAETKKCISYTIITSPFELDNKFYEDNSEYTYSDSRIGQLTEISCNSALQINDFLMSRFHFKTRNMIRKAEKNKIKVYEDNSEESLHFISHTHEENLKILGGLYKPDSFFRMVPKIFVPGKDYNIWIAKYNDFKIGGLLVFCFNKTVEYYTPVIVNEYRYLQPLSLIIYNAMCESSKQGFKWWNWGGTWHSQDGVYQFKRRWGTVNSPYYYYTKILDNSVTTFSKAELLQDFPYFYVLPFNKLSI